MMNQEEQDAKKAEVMEAITPICIAFGIKDFDYILTEDHERLRLGNTLIGCSCNSISATVDEVIGYIFVTRYCENRYVGAFRTQIINRIKAYWIKESESQ